MSSFLHRVGRWSFRHRWTVLVSWLIVLALGGGGAAVFGQGTDNSFSIPGTQSQQALDQLSRTFPEVSGSSAQVVVVAADGHTVTEHAYRTAVDHAVDAFGDISGVRAVTSPYDDTVKGLLSGDDTAGLIRIQLTEGTTTVSQHTKDAITAESTDLKKALPAGATSALGGDLFAQTMPTVSATEAVGLLIAVLVLVLVFRSFIAAGMPLASALLGVGISMTLIFLATAFGTISSTTPMLALMLGLAVGIDYALFIISRHLQQLREGMGAEDSVAKATATSGSAVVFAGTTVLIALVGLAIARIPFLTTMGIAAAVAVAIAVAIAVTLTPALLGFARNRLVPSEKSIARARRRSEKAEAGTTGGFFHGWVRAVTRFPVVTVAAVVVVLGLAAAPALGLKLALPDAGMLPKDNQARQSYDLVAEHFGPGFNGPLIVTGTIIASNDPVKLMDDIGDDIAGMKGVKQVVLATPNKTADTGIVQVVPTTGPDDPATAELVQRIRDRHDHFLKKYDVDLAVTGQTAVGIDVSSRLGGALLPFGIFVVGLSLVLLAMVFRSVWVPIKATIGYLLSVGAAFGAVTWVFIDGGMADALGVAAVGPIISFLPIVLMGVLFGLAMDYEVFLVSRMREEYVHGGDARAAIERGFVGSASVVTAAALIMFGVFAAFVPEGDTNIKPIALGLAVGVFVDAFIVRMTLVPAVLALLGRHAWWMPRWLDRILPSFDVEGESIAHELALADWPGRPAAVAARGVAVGGDDDGADALAAGVDVVVGPGETLVLQSEGPAASAVLAAIAGRTTDVRGDLKVLDLVLPVRAASVRRRVGMVLLDDRVSPAAAVAAARRGRPELLLIDGLELVTDARARGELTAALLEAERDNARHDRGLTVVVAARDAAAAIDRLPGSGTAVRVLRVGTGERVGADERVGAGERTGERSGAAEALANERAREPEAARASESEVAR